MVALILGDNVEDYSEYEVYTSVESICEDIIFEVLTVSEVYCDAVYGEFVEFCYENNISIIYNQKEILTSHEGQQVEAIEVIEEQVEAIEVIEEQVEAIEVIEEVEVEAIEVIVEVEVEVEVVSELVKEELVKEEVEVEEVSELVKEEVEVEEEVVEIKNDIQEQQEEIVIEEQQEEIIESDDASEVEVGQQENKDLESQVTEKKKSLFGGLRGIFKREDKVEILGTDALTTLNNLMICDDLSKIDILINRMVVDGILTDDKVESVLKFVKDNKKFGRDFKFIQACKILGYIDERIAVTYLKLSLNKEVICSDTLDLDNIVKLNKAVSDTSIDVNFVYLEVNQKEKYVVIAHDIDVKPSTYKIEYNFAGYKVFYKYFIEGMTSKILCTVGS